MTQPNVPRPLHANADGALRSGLEPLVVELANLSAEDRAAVVRAAEKAANDAGASRRPSMPRELFEKSVGVISLGGDAVADCNALYDG